MTKEKAVKLYMNLRISFMDKDVVCDIYGYDKVVENNKYFHNEWDKKSYMFLRSHVIIITDCLNTGFIIKDDYTKMSNFIPFECVKHIGIK